jgi:hypothetical protein
MSAIGILQQFVESDVSDIDQTHSASND